MNIVTSAAPAVRGGVDSVETLVKLKWKIICLI